MEQTKTTDKDGRCTIEVPGVGQCEVVGDHDKDGIGRDIHRHGPCSWNGAPYVEVDDCYV